VQFNFSHFIQKPGSTDHQLLSRSHRCWKHFSNHYGAGPPFGCSNYSGVLSICR